MTPVWELIEYPRAARRREIAAQADFCAQWLKAQGFEVVAVTDGPRITVRHSPLCDLLEGAISGYSRGLKGVERYKSVIRLDCEVRWTLEESAVH